MIIHSYPTALMNFCLVTINIYNLAKLMKKDQSFDLVDGKTDGSMLNYMLQYYKEDIIKYFPQFAGQTSSQNMAYIVYCNGNPAGVMLGKYEGDGTARISLDYSVPAYRDCSVGKYLYSKLPDKGIHKLIYGEKESEIHGNYLRKMGFMKEGGVYTKVLVYRASPHSKVSIIYFSALFRPYKFKSLISHVSELKLSAPYRNCIKGI